MDEEPARFNKNSSDSPKHIAPKARSLLIHGLYEKTTTKIGIAATKASFAIKKFFTGNTSGDNRAGTKEKVGENKSPRVDSQETASDHNSRIHPNKAKVNAQDEDNEPSDESGRKTTKEEEAHKLKELVETSHEILVTATTVFPLTLFPDTVTVDRNKVNIHRRNFFFTEEIESIKVEDILKVTCSLGPVFGSISIALVMQPDNANTVKNFWRNDAMRLKRILQGYIVALNNEVDCSKLPKNELLDMLYELGRDTTA
jgi:hypothetical protein